MGKQNGNGKQDSNNVQSKWMPIKRLLPLDADQAEERWQDFLELCQEKEVGLNAAWFSQHPKHQAFFKSIFNLSPYLYDCVKKQLEFFQTLLTSDFQGEFEHILERVIALEAYQEQADYSEAQLMTSLRQLKQQCSLLCGIADLSGHWETMQVTEALTRFADQCLKSSMNVILKETAKTGKIILQDENDPSKNSGWVALAMGKQGGFELNYSSDIDLIIITEPEAGAVVDVHDATTLYCKMTQQLVKFMQNRTADGYVFRMDLRLRPDPSSTPIAIPYLAAMNYYEGRGQNWERAAMIKARPVAGDIKLGENFLKEIRPFIWRKYMDYAALEDIHAIKRQIHSHKGFGEISIEGHNVKLGRGGIREVEFFVQTQQLIAGGRKENIRSRKTLEGMASLVSEGWVEQKCADELITAYLFLRNVEHRLQMIMDEQTHVLGNSKEDILHIALMMGYEDYDSFTKDLLFHLQTVQGHFSKLFNDDEATQKGDLENLSVVATADGVADPADIKILTDLGYDNARAVLETIQGWQSGRFRAVHTPAARQRLAELTPLILKSFAKTARSDEALFAFDEFVKGLPAGVQLFSLLKSNPALLELFAHIMGSAPRLADIITKRPHIFDGLLDPAFFAGVPSQSEVRLAFDKAMELSLDYEDGLNRARIFAAEQRFLIGVRLLSGAIDGVVAAKLFSDLAETLLQGLLNYVRTMFEEKHGKVKDGEIAIIGMGKLGSRELAAGSDLDLILLADHDPDAAYSDGEKPLPTSQYFIRLTQRLIAAMSAPTAEGVLYELDFRLRPSGNAGPLATHIERFEKYQREQAWTWEHMALTRARSVAGDPALMARADDLLHELVSGERDIDKTRKDLVEMRETLEREKESEDIWTLKTVKGGLIDIEFIAQWIALNGVFKDQKTRPCGTDEILRSAQAEQTLQNDNKTLLDGWEIYTKLAQLIQLCIGSNFSIQSAPNGLIEKICKTLDLPNIDLVEQHLSDQQRAVREIFDRALKQ